MKLAAVGLVLAAVPLFRFALGRYKRAARQHLEGV